MKLIPELNLSIGRKLGILLCAIILQIALLVALSTWSLHLVSKHMDEAQQESNSMQLALRAAADIAEINTLMGNLLLSSDLKLDDSMVSTLQKDESAALAEMNGSVQSEKAMSLITKLQTAVNLWHAGNEEVKRLAATQGREKARLFYSADLQDRCGDTKAAVGDLLEYRRIELARINKERTILLQRIIALLLVIGTLIVLLALVFGRLLTRSISQPLETAVKLLTAIAGGDISQNVPSELLTRRDEIGGLAHAMQVMSVSLRDMVQEISGGIAILSGAAATLLTTSSGMTSGSRHTSDKAHLVSAAAEQMSSNITSVADGMAEATTNLHNVALATERMTFTINDIAGKSETARRTTGEARQQAARITAQIKQLGEAAAAIGAITETITEISSQTNLLALNATIEAARAGTAGKGFAVVATEIKALAQQTAAATDDVKSRVIGVQNATSAGISEIVKISDVIDNVSQLVASIGAAIDEQAIAARAIAQNIGEATAGVSGANTRVSESSVASQEIAKDIVSVDRTAHELASGGEDVRRSAAEVSDVAQQLRASVGRFRA